MIEPGSIVSTNTKTSFYDLLQPKLNSSTVSNVTPKHHMYAPESSEKLLEKVMFLLLDISFKKKKNVLQILEMPVHTMPPVRLVCDALLRSMVLQKNT